jgi:hypothetical protein
VSLPSVEDASVSKKLLDEAFFMVISLFEGLFISMASVINFNL